MKLAAILTTLALSTTAAFAQNAAVRDHRSTHSFAPSVARRPVARPPPQPWVLLDTSNANDARNVIRVSSRMKFSKLKLDATRGAAMIDKITVTFANGRTRTIDVNARVGMNDRPLILDLPGDERQITKIVIQSKGRARASYTVSAA